MSSRYDIQTQDLSYDAAQTGDFWADVPAAPSEAPRGTRVSTPVDPLDKVKRLLRGRAALAISLATAGALFGAAIGWMSQSPVYESTGFIRIEPQIVTNTSGRDRGIALADDSRMRSEAMTLESDISLAQMAVSNDAWQRAVGDDMTPLAFLNSSRAKFQQNTNDIRVSFAHPNEKVAEQGVLALMIAYRDHFLDDQGKRLDTIISRRQTFANDAADLVTRIEQEAKNIQRDYPNVADLEKYHEDRTAEYRELLAERERVASELTRAQDVKMKAGDNLSIQDLAEYDSRLGELLVEREDLLAQRRMLEWKGMGERMREMVQIKQMLLQNEQQIADRSSNARRQYFGTVADLSADESELRITQSYIDALNEREN
ncbi:MAG: hypothetical protein AAGK78_14345, partial [Planctomycetota bacterium]